MNFYDNENKFPHWEYLSSLICRKREIEYQAYWFFTSCGGFTFMVLPFPLGDNSWTKTSATGFVYPAYDKLL